MINYTAWPEMLAWPYLILQGWLPYKDIAIAHNPLLLFDLAIFFKFFGVGILQLKMYTWILITINAGLVYFVGSKFWDKKVTILSGILYLVLCITFQGNGLWFDIALTPFALLLYLFVREKKYIWAGIAFALGFLTKQTFVYFIIPTTYYILHSAYYKKSILNFIVGSGVILAIFLATLGFFGILDDYYNLAIKFGIFYLPSATGQVSFPSIKQLIFALSPFLIFIFNTELLLWAFVGALGAYSRFELFHFQPALPFVSIALSIFFVNYKNRHVVLFTMILTICYLLLGLSRQLGSNTRFFEPQVHRLVESIQDLNTKELYIINYWDNIYALTNSEPPKPLIPYIPWYLNYNNNKEIILNGIKDKMPEEIVIGERDSVFPELYIFVDKFYTCNKVEKQVELCIRN